MKQRTDVSYGISQSIMVMYRCLYQLADRSHDETMARLKEWHDANKQEHDNRMEALEGFK